jgi:hypothetical protein
MAELNNYPFRPVRKIIDNWVPESHQEMLTEHKADLQDYKAELIDRLAEVDRELTETDNHLKTV